MRTSEAGFSLLEIVVTVGISLILLAAGGYWMLAMQPGALRGALDDFDANLAAARATAASSGNGATLVFAPPPNGAPGFALRVYAGRPNAVNAVSATTTLAGSSATSVSEAHFGQPPFALFFNSAGYPTGVARYPTLDAQGNAAFAVIAQQPPCPSGGIVLTFTSPQGVSATRTLPCNTDIAGIARANPTPTPNVPHVSPTYLLAHWTADRTPLAFKAAEYGYDHWYASTANGAACQAIASDTGAAPATFASPWPYAQPIAASEAQSAPAPPALTPYTWPAGDPNDPPAWFSLAPVAHNGGMCSVTVADDYGQAGTVTVQVMGDLTPSQQSVALTVGQPAATVQFTKTFDSEKLLLSAGGPCLGVVSALPASGTFPSAPSSTPAIASVTIAPVGKGACDLIVQDQYGERVTIAINVTSTPMASWPEQIEVAQGGGEVSLVPHHAFDLAEFVNGALLGGVADAATTPGCHAYALTTGGAPEAAPPQANALGIFTDANGCYTNSSGTPVSNAAIVLWEPDGQTEKFIQQSSTCSSQIVTGLFNPTTADAVQVDLPLTGGSTSGSCSIAITDGVTTTPTVDHGLTTVNVTKLGCVVGVACNVNFFFVQNSCFRPDAGGCAGGSESLEEGFSDTSTDGGQTWTQGALISVKILCENENGEQCVVPPLTGPPSDGAGVTGLNGTLPASQFTVLGESASGSWFTGATAITEPTFPTIPPGM
jgi:type II secretory pathway pseudopilin PulG